MVRHIVMWKLKEHAEGASKYENAYKLKSLLESLPAKISEIAFFEVGLNFDETAAAYDIVLSSEFATKDALKAYQAHPEHQRLIEFLSKIRIEKVLVDYEI